MSLSKKEKLRRTVDKTKKHRFLIYIPEWALERHIYLFAGSEPFGIKPAWRDSFAFKTGRCSKCGWCCVDPGEDWIFGTKKMILGGEEVTICTKATKSKAEDGLEIVECGAGGNAPWGCNILCAVLERKPHPKCTLEYSKPWKGCK